MLNKLLSQLRKFQMVSPGERIVCAVSGGADSIALLWAMYLLKDKLDIRLEAAHFNHGLRGEESDRDEAFVRDFCRGYGIACHVGRGEVKAGKKGLEAAARDARYAFLHSLGAKIATAHTANDNAETVLMHLVRGTGLKGLGAIAPVNGNLIRPMLTVTREEVIGFLSQYHLSYVEDSSNATDAFLRNRLRHHVMPLLQKENPQLVQNLSSMAMELREDEAALRYQMDIQTVLDVQQLRQMSPSQRSRTLCAFLELHGVKEPERAHVALAEKLVFSQKPSAYAYFPGNIQLRRNYDRLMCAAPDQLILERKLPCPGTVELEEVGVRVICDRGGVPGRAKNCFTVSPEGCMLLRCRLPGDEIRLPGGTKSLKKLFIDSKIPASERNRIVVLADDRGVLGVYGFGPNLDRLAPNGDGIRIRFETIEKDEI